MAKALVFMIMFFAAAPIIHAECYYSQYHLKLQISTSKTQSMVCYQSISACNFNPDSANSQRYLINQLLREFGSEQVLVYRKRIKFKYCLGGKHICNEREKLEVYAFMNDIMLMPSEIQHIKVLSSEHASVFENISSSLSLEDTSWLKTEPTSAYAFMGYLCDHSIVLYDNQTIHKPLLDQLQALQNELQATDRKDSDIDLDDFDQRLWTLIEQVNKIPKLVTVSSCTD